MAYFEDHHRTAIQPGYVDQEGDYQVKITGYRSGEMTNKDGKLARYTQVTCQVNYKTRPNISIFLTEGNNFDGNFTAFCDTFGITEGQPSPSWIGRTGWIHIMLQKKDGFTNMIPRWLLGDDGYVKADVKAAAGYIGANAGYAPARPAPQTNAAPAEGDEFGDIPF